jgi:transcriptional regulator with XRE-family HTH domain
VLKTARLRARLSQSAVARAAGVDASVLSNIESGKRVSLRFETVARLAQVMGVSLDTIAQECGFRFPEGTDESRGIDIARLSDLLTNIERLQKKAQEDVAKAGRVLDGLGRSRKRR